MKPHILVVFAALACAGPLAAQDVPREPRLLRIAASSDGTVLSVDSASLARTGDSTFVVDAVYQLPADTSRQVAADRQVESQEMDCGRARFRGRATTYYLGGTPVPVADEATTPPMGWQPVGDDELPIFQAICGYLLGSFAASLPVTLETGSVDRAPELSNRTEIGRALSQEYPRSLRDARLGGTVRLRFRITTEGRVDSASVRVLWATRQEFGDAAVRVLQRMRFRPARHHGATVAVWGTIPVTFAVFDDGPDPRLPAPPRLPPTRPRWEPPRP
ncbi:MAG TPA: energy transducer TonB [Longimicrobium sp.]|jgi:TonB family protein|nr:energy transducer TonB [Longimicrobium sp.]